MKIGFLHSLIRKDEKLLLNELYSRPGVNVIMIDIRDFTVSFLSGPVPQVDIVLERCISHHHAYHALEIFQNFNIPCINTPQVANTCGNKFLTSLALRNHNIPQPDVRIAFSQDAALQTIENMGYPVILKPAVGSWGRLLTKINDREAAEAILEHKTTLGSYHHSLFYIQQYINKPGRDIRSFVVGNECIAAIYRNSNHWITNTARGATTSPCPITDSLAEISIAAANAVGGGILAIDLLESPNGLLVNEVNYTMEFKNSIAPSNINIPKKIIDFVIHSITK